MRKIIVLSLFLLSIGCILTSITADSEMSEREKWCFTHCDDVEELKECLNEPNGIPESRAGCMFCED